MESEVFFWGALDYVEMERLKCCRNRTYKHTKGLYGRSFLVQAAKNTAEVHGSERSRIERMLLDRCVSLHRYGAETQALISQPSLNDKGAIFSVHPLSPHTYLRSLFGRLLYLCIFRYTFLSERGCLKGQPYRFITHHRSFKDRLTCWRHKVMHFIRRHTTSGDMFAP